MFKQISIIICAVQILSEECKCQELIDLPSDSDEPPLPENKLSKAVTPLRKYYKSKYRMTPQLLQKNIRYLKRFATSSRRQAFEQDVDTTKVLKKKVQTLVELSIVRINRTKRAIFKEIQTYRRKKPDLFEIGNISASIKHEHKLLHGFFDKMLLYSDKSVIEFIKTGIADRMMHSNKKITMLVWKLTQKHGDFKLKRPGFFKHIDGNTTDTKPQSIFNIIYEARHPTALPPENHRPRLVHPSTKIAWAAESIDLHIPTVLPSENLLEHKVNSRRTRHSMPIIEEFQHSRSTDGAVHKLSKESKRQKIIDQPSHSDVVRQRDIPENKLSKTITSSQKYLRNKSKDRNTPEHQLLQKSIRRLKSMSRREETRRRYPYPRYPQYNTGKIIKKKVQTLIELSHVRIERSLLGINDLTEGYKKMGEFIIGYLICILKTEHKQLNDLYDYMLVNGNVSISVSGKIVEEMINSSERISRVVQEMINKHNELSNNTLDSFGYLDFNKVPATDKTQLPSLYNIPTVLPPENLHTKRLPIKTHPPSKNGLRTPPSAYPSKNSKIAVARASNHQKPINSAVLLHRMVTLYAELTTASTTQHSIFPPDLSLRSQSLEPSVDKSKKL